ncbi:LysE family translocator [Chitinimonas koreensis]|uniref:LysE family translocator n=1 Tax=Chitinimonas koreensis TaxID=356302 RepID=UPI0003F904FD|nr:LysE family translocator [Chitinimonas koreensis]QNM94712.1 LysE family translocator [Chitinimonas koreensis]
MLLAFIVATTVISLVPGPSMAIIVMNTARRGLPQGIRTIAGAVLADAVLLLVALSGVGALLHASARAFAVLKWLGVAYLLYLGIQQLRSRPAATAAAPARQEGSAFLQGLGTTLLNPKIIGFLIVYFPQFLDPQRSAFDQLLLLGPLFLLVVFLVFLLCALAARGIAGLLATPRGQAGLQRISGLSLIGCGAYAAAT